jgi:site-specific DNA-adenine methylase
MDPPYVPENSKSFVSYNEDGFDENKHKKLFTLTKDVDCKFIMSNSDTPLLYEYFDNLLLAESGKNYNIKKIKAKRAIKSNDPTATTNELLIYQCYP